MTATSSRRKPLIEAVKYCPGCDELLPEHLFHKNRAREDGRQVYCKSCIRHRRHGIASDEYALLFQKQEGRCAICGSLPVDGTLNVDHDHRTSSIRGLLCPTCNLGLGKFKDDLTLLRRAVAYMEAHGEAEVPSRDEG
jgi:hypothetical protein